MRGAETLRDLSLLLCEAACLEVSGITFKEAEMSSVEGLPDVEADIVLSLRLRIYDIVARTAVSAKSSTSSCAPGVHPLLSSLCALGDRLCHACESLPGLRSHVTHLRSVVERLRQCSQTG